MGQWGQGGGTEYRGGGQWGAHCSLRALGHWEASEGSARHRAPPTQVVGTGWGTVGTGEAGQADLDSDLGADLKAHRTPEVTHDGAPHNTAFRPAMPSDAHPGPQWAFPTGPHGPRALRAPCMASRAWLIAAGGCCRGRALNPQRTGCPGALALTQARPGPRPRRALPQRPSGVAVPHCRAFQNCFQKCVPPPPFHRRSLSGPVVLRWRRTSLAFGQSKFFSSAFGASQFRPTTTQGLLGPSPPLLDPPLPPTPLSKTLGTGYMGGATGHCLSALCSWAPGH